ncbi:uncharacterized protein LOC142985628 [Anticarsia gemmatalis]|uniref:uncharacterized protein LOC142985628 n=1 Tax=Anticarsia gemmatalis TaxID=129554 RepID=UPI003F7670AC
MLHSITILFSVFVMAISQDMKSKTPEMILKEAPWSVKLLMLKNKEITTTTRPERRVGIESFVLRRQAGPPETPDSAADDANMRMKLFRLMYETIRDSDLKVKRAELIRAHYKNSTTFEVGYLMGEVQDKFNVINDFSASLTRYYEEWKPIEHINVYEQVANHAIQINHLIDLIKSVSKGSNVVVP